MELENPNALTLTLSAERSITEGHAVITDLTQARAVILKITQYTNEIKTYKKEDLVISKNSITVPGGIKSGQGFDIELKLMNTVCTYIARAKSIIIEPYTNSVITLEIEEIKPHIILPAKKTGTGTYTFTFFAVANPEKKDGLVFKGSINTRSIHEFAFDKYGRLFFRHNDSTSGSNPDKISDYDNSCTLNPPAYTYNLCIDTEDNTVYYNKTGLYKRQLYWDSWGAKTTGAKSGGQNMQKISVGKHYIVDCRRYYSGPKGDYYDLRCIDKFDIKKIYKKITIMRQGGIRILFGDIIIDGDILYVLFKNYSPTGTTQFGDSKMQVYSLPDFTLLKTVTGFYNAKQFLGKRDEKLYIADSVENVPGVPKRLGIYDTITGKLKFIDVKEFSNEIEFKW